MSAEQTEEPVEPQSEEPKGLLQPSRVGIYACLRSDYGQNVDDLEELLESRAKQSTEGTYYECDVFEEYGPWKADSHRYQ